MITVCQPNSFSEYDDYEIVMFPANDITSLSHTSEHQTQLSKEQEAEIGEIPEFGNPWAETATVAAGCCVVLS